MQKFSETKTLSVIIPPYNCAPYLAETIGGVLQQSYPEIEIVIVNNASTDSILDVPQRSLVKNHVQIKVLGHINCEFLNFAGVLSPYLKNKVEGKILLMQKNRLLLGC